MAWHVIDLPSVDLFMKYIGGKGLRWWIMVNNTIIFFNNSILRNRFAITGMVSWGWILFRFGISLKIVATRCSEDGRCKTLTSLQYHDNLNKINKAKYRHYLNKTNRNHSVTRAGWESTCLVTGFLPRWIECWTADSENHSGMGSNPSGSSCDNWCQNPCVDGELTVLHCSCLEFLSWYQRGSKRWNACVFVSLLRVAGS